jgi:hypothetical protein
MKHAARSKTYAQGVVSQRSLAMAYNCVANCRTRIGRCQSQRNSPSRRVASTRIMVCHRSPSASLAHPARYVVRPLIFNDVDIPEPGNEADRPHSNGLSTTNPKVKTMRALAVEM